jgi:hypothetical protein
MADLLALNAGSGMFWSFSRCRFLHLSPLSSSLADSNRHSGVARSRSQRACRIERLTGFLASASRR